PSPKACWQSVLVSARKFCSASCGLKITPYVAAKRSSWRGNKTNSERFRATASLTHSRHFNELGGHHEVSSASRPCRRQAHRRRGEVPRRHHHSRYRQATTLPRP